MVDAIARRDQLRLLVDGMTAANDLGMTDAVPARVMIHTDAWHRSIQLDNLVIEFKLTAPSRLYRAGRPAMRAVQALYWFKDTLATDHDHILSRLAQVLADPVHGPTICQDLLDGFSTLPAWMQSLVRELPGCNPQPTAIKETGTHSCTNTPPLGKPHGSIPLNKAFTTVIAASDAERCDLFLGTAAHLGTAVQNVEKDFWVCWTLDALFNGLGAGGPCLLFNGGTSLSKAFGLISRFSEDIDIIVFLDDLGHAAGVAELDALSGKKRRTRLEAIRIACQAYINGPLTEQFTQLAAAVIPEARFRLEVDPDDKDGQSLLCWYPAVTARPGDYIRSAGKIESGAKLALDPHVAATVTPYVAQDMPDLTLAAANVMTVKPERTFAVIQVRPGNWS